MTDIGRAAERWASSSLVKARSTTLHCPFCGTAMKVTAELWKQHGKDGGAYCEVVARRHECSDEMAAAS
jgi:transcription elongation factor Elf1